MSQVGNLSSRRSGVRRPLRRALRSNDLKRIARTHMIRRRAGPSGHSQARNRLLSKSLAAYPPACVNFEQLSSRHIIRARDGELVRSLSNGSSLLDRSRSCVSTLRARCRRPAAQRQVRPSCSRDARLLARYPTLLYRAGRSGPAPVNPDDQLPTWQNPAHVRPVIPGRTAVWTSCPGRGSRARFAVRAGRRSTLSSAVTSRPLGVYFGTTHGMHCFSSLFP